MDLVTLNFKQSFRSNSMLDYSKKEERKKKKDSQL